MPAVPGESISVTLSANLPSRLPAGTTILWTATATGGTAPQFQFWALPPSGPWTLGQAYSIPTVALRYFNIYGPRQALSNPYTGAAAIFCGHLLNQKAPVIFEDGLQSRDFVHVSDIVQANLLAMDHPAADYQVLNVGTGHQTTILEVAELLVKRLAPGLSLQPKIEQTFRRGDIRHCFADISKIRERLGFVPRVQFADGIDELVRWVRDQQAEDTFDLAHVELQQRGLVT